MTGAFLLFVAYFVTWDVVRISVNSDTKLFFQIAQNFVYSDDEAKNYIQKEFLDLFEANSSDVNEASDAVVFRAWVGVISLTCISVFSILPFIIFGCLVKIFGS
uniref:ABC transmembrane type-1 domain-containing protein n=1 Tax=Caenorhabditis tropicalis TaxID=1561998 RepID=A0A1I7U9C0_9PELO